MFDMHIERKLVGGIFMKIDVSETDQLKILNIDFLTKSFGLIDELDETELMNVNGGYQPGNGPGPCYCFSTANG